MIKILCFGSFFDVFPIESTKMKFLLIVSLFLTATVKVHSVHLACRFRNDNEGYCCDVESLEISSKDDRQLTSMEGAWKDGKDNDQVKYFYADNRIVKFMPRDLEMIFSNLEKIAITNAKLTEVSREDLKPWGDKLKKVWFNGNDITAIPADLFKHNPNLEFISLQRNKITQVFDGTFENLNQLATLYFDGNKCHDGNAMDDKEGVTKLISEIEKKCKDSHNQKKRDEI